MTALIAVSQSFMLCSASMPGAPVGAAGMMTGPEGGGQPPVGMFASGASRIGGFGPEGAAGDLASALASAMAGALTSGPGTGGAVGVVAAGGDVGAGAFAPGPTRGA